MGNYNDIYMRAYLNDPGNVPRSQAQPLSASPDLIPIGMQPVAPDTLLTDPSWNSVYNNSLVINSKNYLYMRAQNLGSQATTGTFSLYFSKASLLLWPSVWSANQMKTDGGADTQNVLINPGQRGVTPSAFIWKPEQLVNDHYCLVGMVSTPQHPATPPPDGNIRDFASWIANNGSFAWHNVSVVNAGAPTWQKSTYYEQGGVTEDVYFQLNCSNLPEGSQVAFSCGEAGANPPINLKPTTVSTSPSFTTGVISNVQGSFKGDITYSYWAKDGSPPPPGFDITLKAISLSASSDALYKYSSTLQELGVPTPEAYLEMKKSMKKWDSLPWAAHEAYAEQLHMQHDAFKTYSKSAAGPIKGMVVGTDTVYAQTVKS